MFGITETGALVLQVLLQLRHLALKLLIALLGGSFCFTCHSEPAVINMSVMTGVRLCNACRSLHACRGCCDGTGMM